MKIDPQWQSKVTKHVLDVSKLNSPSDIADYMRKHKIDKYLYRVTFKQAMVIKYGMSCPKASTARHGDRIYRQVGHTKSWGEQRLNGASGSDWRIIEDDFKDQFDIEIDHKGLEVTIWDLTNYPFTTTYPPNEVKAMENDLIESYVAIAGHKPIGNVNDEAAIKKTPGIPVSVWGHMFEEVI